MLGLTGVTEIEERVAGVTVSVEEPLMPPKVAVMTVDPAACAVARPAELIVALPLSDELQIAAALKSWVLLSSKTPVAVNFREVPVAMLALTGSSCIEASVAEVTTNAALPKIKPDVAVMVEEPAASDEAMPAALTVTLPVSEELQVTANVISFLLLSEYTPVALNCRLVPGAMLSVEGDTSMAVRLTFGLFATAPLPLSPPPPPHADNAIKKANSIKRTVQYRVVANMEHLHF